MCTEEVCFGLEFLGSLRFLTLNTHSLFKVCSIHSLHILHILNVEFGLSLHRLGCKTTCEAFNLLICFRILINIYGTNVYMFHLDTKFIKTIFKFSFEDFTYLVYFTFHLDNRHTKVRGHVGYYTLNLANHSVLYLFFECFEVKVYKTIKFDEVLVILQSKSKSTTYSYRHRKVWQTRVCDIKIRNCKLYLIISLEIDKIDFSLKWTLSTKC